MNGSGPAAFPGGFLPREPPCDSDGPLLEWSCAHLPNLFKCIVQGIDVRRGERFIDDGSPPRHLKVAGLSVDPDVRATVTDEDTGRTVLPVTRHDVLNV